ncbi:MAG: MobC family plasmid mobilization relaxosome protein [Bifidobacteriaceae bacterium]|jgi:hypothetical protein|nr:MobC family plasmid mobilization relaxosome protein [Bifidobacteriaceae bacterium]MCI1914414.1 MobC family plasmid mobilization relaxosome protein [Bifidobacteriaceae bacterium]MCI1935866.1 MobC family plasmid mobilization relaxosome protein [Bifidobacteriaceae bacterium]
MSWLHGRRRSVAKLVTFTPDEWKDAARLYEVMHQSRGYKDFSDFARTMLTQGKVVRVTTVFDPDTLRGEMGRIGSNINQIAHQANTADTLTKELAQQVLEEQSKLQDLFLRLSDAVEKQVR